MANAATKAAANSGEKKVRKAPVRKAPVQKDYPNKLEWLRAMTEYEEAETAKVNEAKVARLDKRIAAKREQHAALGAELDKLQAERAKLVPAEPDETEGYDEFEIANGRDAD